MQKRKTRKWQKYNYGFQDHTHHGTQVSWPTQTWLQCSLGCEWCHLLPTAEIIILSGVSWNCCVDQLIWFLPCIYWTWTSVMLLLIKMTSECFLVHKQMTGKKKINISDDLLSKTNMHFSFWEAFFFRERNPLCWVTTPTSSNYAIKFRSDQLQHHLRRQMEMPVNLVATAIRLTLCSCTTNKRPLTGLWSCSYCLMLVSQLQSLTVTETHSAPLHAQFISWPSQQRSSLEPVRSHQQNQLPGATGRVHVIGMLPCVCACGWGWMAGNLSLVYTLYITVVARYCLTNSFLGGLDLVILTFLLF